MTIRHTDHPVLPLFLERWSPRAFDGSPIPEADLQTMFEAARWAPSAFNGQPWRFVYAHRDTPHWERLFPVLIPYNQAWVKNASVLMFVISDRFRRAEGREPAPVYSHSFDAGAAWACLALEASAIGWAAHGMSGFDVKLAYEALEIPEAEYRVEAAIAVGKQASPEVLDEPYRSRETPSPRKHANTFAFEGLFRLDGT